jgi:hypothetical protein
MARRRPLPNMAANGFMQAKICGSVFRVDRWSFHLGTVVCALNGGGDIS